MADELPTFAETALVQVDRAHRALASIQELLRGADDYLVAQRDKPVGEKPIIVVENHHLQTIGVSVEEADGGFIVRVTHRQAEAERYVPVQHGEVWFAPEEATD